MERYDSVDIPVWEVVEREISRTGSCINITETMALLGNHDNETLTTQDRAIINGLRTVPKTINNNNNNRRETDRQTDRQTDRNRERRGAHAY